MKRVLVVGAGRLADVVAALSGQEGADRTVIVIGDTLEGPRGMGKAPISAEFARAFEGWEEFPAAELLGPPNFNRYGKTREVCSGCRHKHAPGSKCDRYVSLRRAGSRPCGCVR